eukprot:CAMPEP_0195289226 /NCGR_PEP_ID=MMETSP0707-20130614/5596_1 /TAXON_ID=33640 /ORGANISM="Asterionellopsis glacialis, Strain CCMP134" /LENGTH=281 /DNA_ID=CAMNT_0040349205 /DNA_START=241 /DNA_END=1086 /DNA_ORIENTATION=-
MAMGLYGERKRIYRKADLCSLGTLDSLKDQSSSTSSSSSSGGSGVSSSSSSYHDYQHTCPSAGNYHLYTYFTMPSLSSDSELRYTPDLYLNFTSSAGSNSNNNNKDKGERFLSSGEESTTMATTNQNANSNSKSCFATGTRYQYYVSKARRTKGVWVLGGATVVFCSLFAICIYMSWRRKKRIEKERQARQQQQQQEDSKYEYMREHHGHVIPWNHHYHRSNQSVSTSSTHVPLGHQIQQYRRQMTNDDGGSRTTSGDGSLTSGSMNHNVPVPALVPSGYR